MQNSSSLKIQFILIYLGSELNGTELRPLEFSIRVCLHNKEKPAADQCQLTQACWAQAAGPFHCCEDFRLGLEPELWIPPAPQAQSSHKYAIFLSTLYTMKTNKSQMQLFYPYSGFGSQHFPSLPSFTNKFITEHIEL